MADSTQEDWWNEQQFQPFVVQVAMLCTEFRIYAAQRANAHWGTGHQDPFDIIPFADGSDPTAAPLSATQTIYARSRRHNPVFTVRATRLSNPETPQIVVFGSPNTLAQDLAQDILFDMDPMAFKVHF
ncbi:hypothetical protein C8R44DRAFT_753756 [Mycena epipterygia]|nr:hypothetical protein C8R44DRAFT_753756 [Mycena epipterygia]